MKKLIFILLLFPFLASGQDLTYQQMPSFKFDLQSYLVANLKYPRAALNDSLEVRCVVQFVVGKDGSVTDVKVKRSAGNGFDEAVADVLKHIPKGNPGRQGGKPVNVYFTLPIAFLGLDAHYEENNH